MEPITLACAVGLEAAPLLERLSEVTRVAVHGRTAHRGLLDGRPVVLLIAGMGKTNAAQSLTSLFERVGSMPVVGFGVGGAYESSGLEVAQVAVATVEYYGDEGVSTAGGWISCEGIGIPLAEVGGDKHFNAFPVDESFVEPMLAQLADRGIQSLAGPFVTVSTCSGTAARGAVLERRFGAICETMEGAAYAHVARLYGVPYLEVRGISNLVEDRDVAVWRLQ
jgi:futalosine hydrolase